MEKNIVYLRELSVKIWTLSLRKRTHSEGTAVKRHSDVTDVTRIRSYEYMFAEHNKCY